MMSLWGAVMGHANLIKHGAGWMEGGLTASFEKMVLDADLLQMMVEFMVQRGAADVASLDSVTHALLGAHDPDSLAGTRVLCETPSAPGLPYVTAAATSDDDIERLRQGLAAACADPNLAEVRTLLLIDGVEILSERTYDRILDMENEAADHGVTALA